MNPWVILGGAIASEVVATTSLRLAARAGEPAKYGWYALVGIGYLLSFWLLSMVLKRIELGVSYAVWSGVGTAATAALGVALFGEVVTAAKVACLILIVAGVIGLNLSGAGG
jgi:small multidrug resistance pump